MKVPNSLEDWRPEYESVKLREVNKVDPLSPDLNNMDSGIPFNSLDHIVEHNILVGDALFGQDTDLEYDQVACCPEVYFQVQNKSKYF
jgi:hypothetical protein